MRDGELDPALVNATVNRLVAERDEALERADDHHAGCPVGCVSGGCETCPCCSAGWCVFGLDGMLPDESDENYGIWLDIAAEHNPVAKALAEARERADRLARGIEDEVAQALSDITHPGGDTSSCGVCIMGRRIRAALAAAETGSTG